MPKGLNIWYIVAMPLTKITIPASVTSIGYAAFYNAAFLTTVTLETGSQLTSIGEFAFFQATLLTGILFTKTVINISGYAFEGATSLTIYAEASSQPLGWDANWDSNNATVNWN
jgi:hypothetical protein